MMKHAMIDGYNWNAHTLADTVHRPSPMDIAPRAGEAARKGVRTKQTWEQECLLDSLERQLLQAGSASVHSLVFPFVFAPFV